MLCGQRVSKKPYFTGMIFFTDIENSGEELTMAALYEIACVTQILSKI